MQQSAGVLDDQILLQVRLRRFMNWFLASFTTLAVLMSIALLRTPAPALNGMLGTATIYALVIVLLVARFALARRPVAAVFTVSVGVFVLSMVDVVLLPRALPAMVFLPVLAIAMALPYISGRALFSLSVAATLTIAVSASLSEFVRVFAPAP
jgi:hypothetical protein